MSLTRAILAIADRMEARVGVITDESPAIAELVSSWASMLRVAVDAASDTGCIVPFDSRENSAAVLEMQSRQRAERLEAAARVRMEEMDKQSRREEASGVGMVELVDDNNPNDVPTFVEYDPKMPVGARMLVAGKVCQLREDRKLHFDMKKGG